MAVLKQIDGHDTIVGHISQRISASCSAFIRRGGIIQSTITGSRRYNVDLIQGGLEVPCKLRFIISSSQEFCKKTEISVCAALSATATFSLKKSTSMIAEQDTMAVDITMEESCKSLSGSLYLYQCLPMMMRDILCQYVMRKAR